VRGFTAGSALLHTLTPNSNQGSTMSADDIKRNRILQQLDGAGVVVTKLPGGCLRLDGAYGNVILTTDVCNLSHRELSRLCAGT
jgi:hypothetical protein